MQWGVAVFGQTCTLTTFMEKMGSFIAASPRKLKTFMSISRYLLISIALQLFGFMATFILLLHWCHMCSNKMRKLHCSLKKRGPCSPSFISEIKLSLVRLLLGVEFCFRSLILGVCLLNMTVSSGEAPQFPFQEQSRRIVSALFQKRHTAKRGSWCPFFCLSQINIWQKKKKKGKCYR